MRRCIHPPPLALQCEAGGAGNGTPELSMERHCTRLIEDRMAVRPQAGTVVYVLVICWFVALVEATQLREAGPRGQEQRPRAEVDWSLEIEFGRQRISAAAVRFARAVAPDDRAGFLQASVVRNQLSSDCTNVGCAIRGGGCHERMQGAWQKLGIVVQEQEELPVSPLSAEICADGETPILIVANYRDAVDAFEQRRGFVGRRVINDNRLGPSTGLGGERAEARQRQIGAVPNHDDDRHLGRLHPLQRQPGTAGEKVAKIARDRRSSAAPSPGAGSLERPVTNRVIIVEPAAQAFAEINRRGCAIAYRSADLRGDPRLLPPTADW